MTLNRALRLAVIAVAVVVMVTFLSPTPPASATSCTISDSAISVTIDATSGIELTEVRDVDTTHDWISSDTALFEFALDNGIPYNSAAGVTVDSASSTGTTMTIAAHANALPLDFDLVLEIDSGAGAVIQAMTVTSTDTSAHDLRLVYPKIHNFASPGSSADLMGTVPAESGGVANLNDVTSLGMGLNIDIGLPTAMNFMEVASVYDGAGGGGLYFADLDGNTNDAVAPLQFVISSSEIAAFYFDRLKAGEELTLPRLGIGVTPDGDWHEAVDYYLNAHGSPSFPTPPAWLREAGAIYSPTAGGAGAIYLYQQPLERIDNRINSFTDLPDLLDEAESLGTNILYLSDYWEGIDQDPNEFPPYYNKGDYIPTSTLGGANALIEGIEDVHDEGGYMIAYVEPFIVYELSDLGQAVGTAWGGRDANGSLDDTYNYYYSMVAPFSNWEDQLIEICRRLVGDYGFDGIFLDSTGWQLNRPMGTSEEGVFYSSQEWSLGMARLINRVRNAVVDENANAVVLSESVSGPLAQQIDGGTTADLAWLWPQNDEQLQASPLRYATSAVSVFNNGRICDQVSNCTDMNLDYNITTAEHKVQLNQVFAAGQNLALSYLELGLTGMQTYVSNLLSIRSGLVDAFVYGRQSYQPATGDDEVFAFNFEGDTNQVITVVNAGSSSYSGTLTLETAQSNSTWIDQLTSTQYVASGTSLSLTLDAGDLAVLVRQGTFSSTGASSAPTMPYDPVLVDEDFNDGRFLDEWTPLDGTWSNPGTVLRANNPSSGATIYFDTRTGNDFTLEADLEIISGGEAGVSFRQADDGTQGYDVILSRFDNRVKLAKRPYSVLGDAAMTFDLNTTYEVKVVADGPDIDVYVNDDLKFSVNDSTWSSGRFGFTNFMSVADFDNMYVTEMEK